MKALIILQKFAMIGVLIYGGLVMFSEVPITESVWSQLFVTLGGLGIVLAAVIWGLLIALEEKIVEASTKTL